MQPRKLGLSLLYAAVACAAPQGTPPVHHTMNVTVTTSLFATPTPEIPHIEIPVSDWYDVPSTPTIWSTYETVITTSTAVITRTSAAIIRVHSTASGFEEYPPTFTKEPPVPYSKTTVTERFDEPTKPGQTNPPTAAERFDEPTKPGQTNPPTAPPSKTSGPPLTQNPGDSQTSPTPIYTLVTTVVNSQTTQIPVFILPGSAKPATLGQTVVLDGQTTVLTPPKAHFTTVSTTVNGVPTVVPLYVISGSSTASLGQTVTLDGTVSVLSTPTSSNSVPKTTGKEFTARGANMGRVEWSVVAVGAVGVVFGWM